MRTIKSIAAGLYLTVASIALSAGSAQAILMSGDDVVHGTDSITLDTVNNLEWLDLTLSTSTSFNDAAAQFVPGGTFEGFRHATAAEILSLFSEAGITIGFTTANVAPITALQALIGITENSPGAVIASRGSYDDSFDGINASIAGSGQILIDLGRPNSGYAEAAADVSLLVTVSAANRGHWLVRSPIPEPSALILFGSSVVLLGAIRRRKRGN